MGLDKMLPTAPKGNLMAWLTAISVILVIAFIADTYVGDGDMFGLLKKKPTDKTPV